MLISNIQGAWANLTNYELAQKNMNFAAIVRAWALLMGLMLPALHASNAFAVEAPAQALETVARLEGALIRSMQEGAEKNLEQRRRDLAPVIDESLDYERMGRFIFGSEWINFPESDRKAFIQAFRKLSSTNYAARFDHFGGESFTLQASDSQENRRARVRSHFIKKNGEAVVFDYLLVNSDSGWRIVNIIVEGVSDLALKRTQYSEIYKSSGMSGVIEAMSTQEQQLENE